MKKIIYILLILGFAFQTGIAQNEKGKGKSKDGKGKSERTGDKPEKGSKGKGKSGEAKEKKSNNGKSDVDNAKSKKEKSNNGNAYGKNKGDLSGKEFGQERAASAKLKKAESISHGNDVVSSSQVKINEARAKVQQQKSSGEISEKEALEKEVKIKKAESKLAELEEELKKNGK